MKLNKFIPENTLIANFSDSTWKDRVDLFWDDLEDYLPSYHLYWDYLMPIVEQIEKTKEADIIIHAKNLVEISYAKETKHYFSGSLIENVWRACVEFIKWYNQNK